MELASGAGGREEWGGVAPGALGARKVGWSCVMRPRCQKSGVELLHAQAREKVGWSLGQAPVGEKSGVELRQALAGEKVGWSLGKARAWSNSGVEFASCPGGRESGVELGKTKLVCYHSKIAPSPPKRGGVELGQERGVAAVLRAEP